MVVNDSKVHEMQSLQWNVRRSLVLINEVFEFHYEFPVKIIGHMILMQFLPVRNSDPPGGIVSKWRAKEQICRLELKSLGFGLFWEIGFWLKNPYQILKID